VVSNRKAQQGPAVRPHLRGNARVSARSGALPGRAPSVEPRRMPGAVERISDHFRCGSNRPWAGLAQFVRMNMTEVPHSLNARLVSSRAARRRHRRMCRARAPRSKLNRVPLRRAKLTMRALGILKVIRCLAEPSGRRTVGSLPIKKTRLERATRPGVRDGVDRSSLKRALWPVQLVFGQRCEHRLT
jgi:hypothetical protein